MTGSMEGGRRRGRGVAITLVLGIVIGVLAAVLLPPLLRPYLPRMFRGEEQVLTGVVVAKGTEGERLLITLATPQGTTLATFSKETARIDLLVRTGDSLALAIKEYGPFIENPRIARVMSAEGMPREVVPDTVAGMTEGQTP